MKAYAIIVDEVILLDFIINIDYTAVLYKAIGRRIKIYREHNFKNLQEFSDKSAIAVPTLSLIINGKAVPEKNKYYLTYTQIETLADHLGISKEELILGNDNERERFIKLIICAFLMYGAETNPFIYFDKDKPLELFQWALTQDNAKDFRPLLQVAIDNLEKNPNIDWGEKIQGINKIETPSHITSITVMTKEFTISELYNQIIDFFQEEYPFFFNAQNKEDYDLLTKNRIDTIHFLEKEFKTDNPKQNSKKRRQKTEYEKIVEIENFKKEISYLITSQIINDYEIAKIFISRLSKYSHKDKKKTVEIIVNFFNHQGYFGDFISDFGENGFHLFAKAFEKYWLDEKNFYINLFKGLFDSIKIENYGLKIFTNDYLNNRIVRGFTALKAIDHSTLENSKNFIIRTYINVELYKIYQNITKQHDISKPIIQNYWSEMESLLDRYLKILSNR